MPSPKLSSLTAVVSAGLLCLAQGAASQSLAEIAAKQKEKRKAKPTKVYTEEDLKKGPTRGFTPGEPAAPGAEGEAAAPTSAASGSPSAEGGQAQPVQKSEDEQRAEREKAWRDKLQRSRENVTQLTGEVSRLETALNDLTVPVYGTARTNRLAALDKAKQQLAAAQQSVTDLEEEGRRNGFR